MSLALPVVILKSGDEEVGRFWPINRRHGEDFIAWYNERKEAEGDWGKSIPKAEMGQAARSPHPWDAWADNCATEQTCLRFRGFGRARVMPHTRPDEELYRPQPTPDDDSLSMMG